MKTPTNPFKQAIANRQAQIGLWVNLANPISTEICAGAGFDWLLLDGEHSPNTLTTLLGQLQAVAAYPGTHTVGRVPLGQQGAGWRGGSRFHRLPWCHQGCAVGG
jgi:4-hydroxy-2-oxoheptanedioate aldolase